MSSKNKFFFSLLTLIFLLSFANVYAANEDFKATAQKTILELCSCATLKEPITIKNTGDFVSTYTVSISGDAAKWSTISVESFILEPGKSGTIFNHIRPPCGTTGDYELFITITTKYGLQKSFSQTLSVKRCPNIGVAITNFSQSNCACASTNYQFDITNTGDFIETYDLSVEPFSDYISYSANPITLRPKSTAPVFVYITPPCSYNEDYNLTFQAYARLSQFVALTPFFLDVRDCYNYSLSVEDSIEICEEVTTEERLLITNLADFSNNYDLSLDGPEWAELSSDRIWLSKSQSGVVDFILNPPKGSEGNYQLSFTALTETGEVERSETVNVKVEKCYSFDVELKKEKDKICCGQKIYKFTVKNNGKFTDTYLLSVVGGADWINISPSELEVEPDEKKKAELVVNAPCRDEHYDLNLSVAVKGEEQIKKSAPFALEVLSKKSCYKPELKKESVRVYYQNRSYGLPVENTGLDSAQYTINVAEAPSWFILNTTLVELEAGKKGYVDFYTEPGFDIPKGEYEVELTFDIVDKDVSYGRSFNLELKKESVVISNTVQFFKDYTYYVIVGVLVLIILIVFFTLLTKHKVRKLRKKLVEAKKPKKEVRVRKKRPTWVKVLLTIIILLVVLAAGLVIYSTTVYEPALEENITNATFSDRIKGTFEEISNWILPEMNVTEENISVEEEIPESFLYQVWNESTTKEINLSAHVVDPDNDELLFNFSQTENIDVIVEGGVAYLTPKSGWSGEETVVFTVLDSAGGKRDFPEMTLVVKDVPTSYVDTYFDYVLIGIILLIIIIGVLSEIERKKTSNPKKKKRK